MSVRNGVCAVLLTLLAGCASTPDRDRTHRVRDGDTLYAIAMRYKLDYRDVARWNGIGRDYRIYPGQVLRLAPGARTPVARTPAQTPVKRPTPVIPAGPPVKWQWPTSSKLFTNTSRPNGGVGLTFNGTLDDPVTAAGDGHVVYTGSGLMGYGQLIIVKHNDTYLSAYGHTAALLVSEGDQVKAGQRIATMGAGTQGRPMLYFEIRVNGRPIDPLQLLPKR